jgi:type IV pilus assembly protein PilA
MRKNKGFTLIELMVVILIVAILAAVLAPMMTGRIKESKWTEGRAAAGTIATALRAYFAEHEGWVPEGTATDITSGVTTQAEFAAIGIEPADLDGKYFSLASYVVSGLGGDTTAGPQYTITVDPTVGGKAGAPTGILTLDNTGAFVYTP